MDGLGERISKLETQVDRLAHIIDGNGQIGLDRFVRDFVAEWRGVESERVKAERKRGSRITIVLTIIGLLLAYLTWRVDAKRISEAVAPTVSAAHAPQDAGNSPAYTAAASAH